MSNLKSRFSIAVVSCLYNQSHQQFRFISYPAHDMAPSIPDSLRIVKVDRSFLTFQPAFVITGSAFFIIQDVKDGPINTISVGMADLLQVQRNQDLVCRCSLGASSV